jgi:hypothetical protein
MGGEGRIGIQIRTVILFLGQCKTCKGKRTHYHIKMRANTIFSVDPKRDREIFKKILVDFKFFGKHQN